MCLVNKSVLSLAHFHNKLRVSRKHEKKTKKEEYINKNNINISRKRNKGRKKQRRREGKYKDKGNKTQIKRRNKERMRWKTE